MDRMSYIENDYDNIDDEELPHDSAYALLGDDFEQVDGLPDIETRNDEFLNAESGHLDIFDVEVALSVGGISSITAPIHNCRDAVKQCSIDDDHPQDCAKNPRIIDN
jgi:hypothetical protein